MGAASALVDICAHLKKFFTDFRPETQSVTINFAMRTCEISFKVDIPAGWRKRQRKMVVPAHGGFSITKMFDSVFNQYRHEWMRAGTDYILDASKLPFPATCLVTMEGMISKNEGQCCARRCRSVPCIGSQTARILSLAWCCAGCGTTPASPRPPCWTFHCDP